MVSTNKSLPKRGFVICGKPCNMIGKIEIKSSKNPGYNREKISLLNSFKEQRGIQKVFVTLNFQE